MVRYPFRNLVFQGGGVKATAYQGALRALEEEGILPQINRVAGSSAGAALAALVSLRLSSDEIRDIYDSYDIEQITAGTPGDMPGRSSTSSFLRRELERLQNSFASVSRLATKFGWYSSEYTYQWIQDLIAKYGRVDGMATFLQLRRWGFRDLFIVVSNLSTHRTEIFSADSTPHVAVADALIMTQAMPVIFESVQFDGQKIGQGDFYSDGGLLINYPLRIFDEHAYVSRNRWFVNGVNWETLGCRLYTPEDCPKRSREITNLVTYAQNVLEALVETQAESYNASRSAQRRTINISDCCIRSTDWGVWSSSEDDRYQRLCKAGETAARDYLDNYKPPLIKPLLPFSWYLDRWWRRFTRQQQKHG